jgi:hypothetical protein
MENRIPIPTDNIYKFYALFGLLVFIFALGSTIYVSGLTNDFLFTAIVDVEGLKAIEKPTSVELAKRKTLERRIEIAISNKDFYIRALGVIGGIAVISMFFGFSKWHRTVQPIQDEITRLQLEKLRREVAELDNLSISSSRTDKPEDAGKSN